MNLSRAAKRAFLSIIAVIALVAGLSFSPNTVNAAVEKTISSAGGSISFTYTTQASITNLSSKPAWLSVYSRLNSSTSVTYTITASANPNCGSRSFDLYFSGTNETYRITQYGLGHSYTVYEKTNPTCSSYGHECFKCARCNSRTQGNSIPPLAHTYTTEKKAATYTATGYEKTYCKVCGHVQKTTTIAKLKETVTYDPNGGTASVTSRQVTHGGTYGKVDNAKRTGYTFAGWYTAKSGGSRVYETTTVTATGNHTLYAHWTAKTITVTLNPVGGDKIDPSSNGIKFGDKYGNLPTPNWTGHKFEGWYTAKDGGTKIEASTVVSNASNHTLYAHWSLGEYTVTFMDGNTKVSTKTVKYNSTYGELPTRTKTGFNNATWYTATSGGSQIKADTKVTITANQTLYARWTAKTITVTLNPVGGDKIDPSSYGIKFGDKYGNLPTPNWTGHKFEGWYTAKDGGTKIEASTVVSNASNHTLYAHWTAINYTLAFVDGTTTHSTKTVTYGSTYGKMPPEPYKSGYVFVGWFTDPVGGSEVKDATKVTKTAPHSLYAHWAPEKIKIRFNNMGYIMDTKNVAYNGTYGELPTPTRSGDCEFLGWYKGTNGGIQVKPSDIVKETSDTVTLYAHWLVRVPYFGSAYNTYWFEAEEFGDHGYFFTTHKWAPCNDGQPDWIKSKPFYGEDADSKKLYNYFTLLFDEFAGEEQSRYTLLYVYEKENAHAVLYKLGQKKDDTDGDGIIDKYDPEPERRFDADLKGKIKTVQPLFITTTKREIPKNSFIESEMRMTRQDYMDWYAWDKLDNDLYIECGADDEKYISEIIDNYARVLAESKLIPFGNLLLPKATAVMEHYITGNGSEYAYDAKDYIRTGKGYDMYCEGVKGLMTVCEKGTQTGRTVTYTTLDSGRSSKDELSFNTISNIDAFLGLGTAWQGMSGTCSFDGETYTLDLEYFIQDVYTWHYYGINGKGNERELFLRLSQGSNGRPEDDITMSLVAGSPATVQMESPAKMINIEEFGFLVGVGRAKQFKVTGQYETRITWKAGQDYDKVNLLGSGSLDAEAKNMGSGFVVSSGVGHSGAGHSY